MEDKKVIFTDDFFKHLNEVSKQIDSNIFDFNITLLRNPNGTFDILKMCLTSGKALMALDFGRYCEKTTDEGNKDDEV